MASVNAVARVVTASIVLLLVCEYSSAQGNGGCDPVPPVTLVSGVGTLPNGVPSISTGSPGEKLTNDC